MFETSMRHVTRVKEFV